MKFLIEISVWPKERKKEKQNDRIYRRCYSRRCRRLAFIASANMGIIHPFKIQVLVMK